VIDNTGDQDGLPNSPLPDSIALRVIDRHGNGVANVEVRFRPLTGGGTVSPGVAFSDANGIVRVEWTLGPVIGDQQLQAFAPGAGAPVTIGATISQVVFGEIVLGAATVGGVVNGAVRIDTNLFPTAVGAAHVVITWDPAKLQLVPASVTSGNYARSVRRINNTTGVLELISTDPAMQRGDFAVANLAFNVVGGAGTTTTVGYDIVELIGVNFTDASAAGVASDFQLTIN